MCGRFSGGPPSEISEAFEAKPPPVQLELTKRYNICPRDDAAIVVLRDGERHIEVMRWGWEPIRRGVTSPLINIRVDALGRVRAYESALASRRLLVPVTGFYEWREEAGERRPYWFHPKGLAALAGLYVGDRFAILTGEPNELVWPFHDRMPVALDRTSWSAWLDPGFPVAVASELLQVPLVGDWAVRRVSSRVSNVRLDGPECIEPAAAPVQGSLF